MVLLSPIVFYLLLIGLSYNTSGDFHWREKALATLPFFIGCSLIAVPGLLLHLKYYSLDKDKSLQFKSSYFIIANRMTVNKIYYKDIVKVERHDLMWRRVPWDNYGYLKVYTKNGDSYIFTSLLCDHRSIAAYLKQKGLDVDDFESFYPWII